jgi:hypothetical protein
MFSDLYDMNSIQYISVPYITDNPREFCVNPQLHEIFIMDSQSMYHPCLPFNDAMRY